MAALTVAEKLAVAEICEYLVTIAIQKGGLNGGGIDLQLPTKIYNLRTTIQYQYEQDPSDDTLEAVTNYLYGMCMFNLQAQSITGSGGVIAAISGGTNLPVPYQFTVAASGTFMIDGQSAQTITAFIGYNLIFVRGNITQSVVNDGVTSYYSWTKSIGAFTAVPAVTTGELIQLFAV